MNYEYYLGLLEVGALTPQHLYNSYACLTFNSITKEDEIPRAYANKVLQFSRVSLRVAQARSLGL